MIQEKGTVVESTMKDFMLDMSLCNAEHYHRHGIVRQVVASKKEEVEHSLACLPDPAC